MKSINVLIADCDPLIVKKLSWEILNDKELELSGVVDNGNDAYNCILQKDPDIIICDLLLPQLDAFSLWEKLKLDGLNNNEMKFIITTPLTNNMLISEMFRRGVDYVLTKPYDTHSITDKIKRIYHIMNSTQYTSQQKTDIEQTISENLNSLGIPANLAGYKYISSAMKAVYDDEGLLDSITKILYPQIAKEYHSTPQRVEKSMRHAIEVAWRSNENTPQKLEFNYVKKEGKTRPTNSEFIAILNQKIKTQIAV